MLKKYRITTTHTVIASSQQEALRQLAKVTAATPKSSSNKNSKLAEQMADQMIEIACKYAGKWGKTSNVGFVTIYGKAQGLVIMDKNSLRKYLTQQKENLVDTIVNDGKCFRGVLKGKEFDLKDGDIEDNIFKIFISYMHRLGLAIASTDGDKILSQVFYKVIPEYEHTERDIKHSKREEEGGRGIEAGITWVARISYKNLKPAYKQGVEGWEKMFKVLNKSA